MGVINSMIPLFGAKKSEEQNPFDLPLVRVVLSTSLNRKDNDVKPCYGWQLSLLWFGIFASPGQKLSALSIISLLQGQEITLYWSRDHSWQFVLGEEKHSQFWIVLFLLVAIGFICHNKFVLADLEVIQNYVCRSNKMLLQESQKQLSRRNVAKFSQDIDASREIFYAR